MAQSCGSFYMKECIRCGSEITTGRSSKYCGRRCAKLYLKAMYRSRNKESLNLYNREYRKRIKDIKPGLRLRRLIEKKTNSMSSAKCIRCGTRENLHVHHIRPKSMGGEDTLENTTILCAECHIEWHKVVPNFYWDKYNNTPPLDKK